MNFKSLLALVTWWYVTSVVQACCIISLLHISLTQALKTLDKQVWSQSPPSERLGCCLPSRLLHADLLSIFLYPLIQLATDRWKKTNKSPCQTACIDALQQLLSTVNSPLLLARLKHLQSVLLSLEPFAGWCWSHRWRARWPPPGHPGCPAVRRGMGLSPENLLVMGRQVPEEGRR